MSVACASFTSFDFGGVKITAGWTKKELINFVEDLRKQELKHIESVKDSFNRAITKFENSARAIMSSCPPQILERPYLECIEKICDGTKDNFLSNLIQEEKKRSRQEWEDSVRTRTGKRPRTASRPASTRSERGPRTVRKKQSSSPSAKSMSYIMESDNETSNLIGVEQPTKLINLKTTSFAVASTPIDGARPVFAVPTTRCKTRLKAQPPSSTNAPATRSRLRSVQQTQAPAKSPILVSTSSKSNFKRCASKSKGRLLSPGDTLQSTRGTPIRNPLSLINEKNPVDLSSPEIKHLRSLIFSMQKALDQLQ